VLGLLTLLLLLIVAGGFFTQAQLKQSLKLRNLQAAENYVEGLSVAIIDSLIQKDYAEIESRIRQAFTHSDISSIEIFDPSGKLVSGIVRQNNGALKLLFTDQKWLAPDMQGQRMLQTTHEDRVTTIFKLNVGVELGLLKIESTPEESSVIFIGYQVKIYAFFIITMIIVLLVLGFFLWRAYFSIAQYEQVLFDKNVELIHTNTELVQANQHKTDFLANMSHELRTPLSAIIGFSEALENKVFGELNSKQLGFVQDIQQSGKSLLGLINDILYVARIESGKLEVAQTEFSLPELVASAVQSVHSMAEQKKITIAQSLSDSTRTVTADQRQIKQILQNLLNNAIKFNRDGGSVLISTINTAQGIEVSVKDTGIGIDEAHQQLLFKQFRQLGDDYTIKGEGAGLGLFIAKRLIELHGGWIKLHSTVGEGSVFSFLIPTHRQP
jgi:signal transduction histidine kinase